MKTKKKIIFIMSFTVLLCSIYTGCNVKTDDSNEITTTTTTASETTDKDKMSESEVRSRAMDAVKEKFDSIPAYSVQLPDSSCSFSRFGSVSGDADIDFVESSNTYFVEIRNGTCGVHYTYMGVDLFSQFEAQFSASVKVYSNGDTSVDTFNYEIVKLA